MVFICLGPACATLAVCLQYYDEDSTHWITETFLKPLMCAGHFLTLCILYDRARPDDSRLPSQFRAVLYLDVFSSMAGVGSKHVTYGLRNLFVRAWQKFKNRINGVEEIRPRRYLQLQEARRLQLLAREALVELFGECENDELELDVWETYAKRYERATNEMISSEYAALTEGEIASLALPLPGRRETRPRVAASVSSMQTGFSYVSASSAQTGVTGRTNFASPKNRRPVSNSRLSREERKRKAKIEEWLDFELEEEVGDFEVASHNFATGDRRTVIQVRCADGRTRRQQLNTEPTSFVPGRNRTKGKAGDHFDLPWNTWRQGTLALLALWGGALFWHLIVAIIGFDISIISVSVPPVAKHPSDVRYARNMHVSLHGNDENFDFDARGNRMFLTSFQRLAEPVWYSRGRVENVEWPHAFFTPHSISCLESFVGAHGFVFVDKYSTWKYDGAWDKISYGFRDVTTAHGLDENKLILMRNMSHRGSPKSIRLPQCIGSITALDNGNFVAEQGGILILFQPILGSESETIESENDVDVKVLGVLKRPRVAQHGVFKDYKLSKLTTIGQHLLVLLPAENRVHIWDLNSAKFIRDVVIEHGKISWHGLCARQNERGSSVFLLGERKFSNRPDVIELHNFAWPPSDILASITVEQEHEGQEALPAQFPRIDDSASMLAQVLTDDFPNWESRPTRGIIY
jgi:hypothetical protein